MFFSVTQKILFFLNPISSVCNPMVWFSLKKSLHCKSEPSDVHTPETRKQHGSILNRRSGCSRSIANLKDVINGSKRHHVDRAPSCSPRSIGSSEFGNPIAHEVILSDSRCELKITGFHHGPGGKPTMHYFNPSFRDSAVTTPPRKMSSASSERERRALLEKQKQQDDSNGVTCHKCGERFVKWEALESHHLSKHAVTELVEGESSRKVVEIICRSSWLKSENHCVRIDRVLKVHNMQKALVRFEEYRDLVKTKASKLPKKHPRCLADGNELLRFYGTTLSCSLGTNGSSSLCVSDKCSVCQIIRYGFSAKRELKREVGVFTTSTSGRAFESIEMCGDDLTTRKALIVCRVIAGRVHRPLENVEEMAGQMGFDSLAGKVGLYLNIEELYLLNPKALLPCFVVICKV